MKEITQREIDFLEYLLTKDLDKEIVRDIETKIKALKSRLAIL